MNISTLYKILFQIHVLLKTTAVLFCKALFFPTIGVAALGPTIIKLKLNYPIDLHVNSEHKKNQKKSPENIQPFL